MSTVLLIARRELGGYFRTMTGYIIAGLLLLADGILFHAFVLSAGRAGRLPAAGRTAGVAVVTWVAINLPAYVLAPTAWSGFWSTWIDSLPSYGSFWEFFDLVDW